MVPPVVGPPVGEVAGLPVGEVVFLEGVEALVVVEVAEVGDSFFYFSKATAFNSSKQVIFTVLPAIQMLA